MGTLPAVTFTTGASAVTFTLLLQWRCWANYTGY